MNKKSSLIKLMFKGVVRGFWAVVREWRGVFYLDLKKEGQAGSDSSCEKRRGKMHRSQQQTIMATAPIPAPT